MKDLISYIIPWVIGMFMLVLEIVLGLSMVITILKPTDQEVQCTSIDGAKWSGENCYKNGIKINFNNQNQGR